MCIFNTTLQSHITFCVFSKFISQVNEYTYMINITIDKEVWLVYTIMRAGLPDLQRIRIE